MTNAELLTAWFENLWNRGDESTIDELAAPDLVGHGLGPSDIRDREGLRAFYRGFRAAFPSVRVDIQRATEAGDLATVLTQVEVISADGRGPFRFAGSCTARIVDGRIVEGWNYFDFLSLLTQMEAVRPDAMAAALGSVSATPAP